MEPKKIEVPSQSACSFEPVLHPQYEAIKAKCDAWLLDLTAPTSASAVEFWEGCRFSLLGSFSYAHCPAERVIHIVNFLACIFTLDDKDDDPSLLGSLPIDSPALRRRHHILLACCYPTHTDLPIDPAIDSPCFIKDMRALHSVCEAMLADMSPRLQARFLEIMRDYVNGVALQCHYRSMHSVPEVSEYIAIRRAVSLSYVGFLLLEYGLAIEMDEETLESELFQQLQDAGVDHVALSNDILSCKMEIFGGDHMNLPSIIYFDNAVKQRQYGAAGPPPCTGGAGADMGGLHAAAAEVGYTFEDAMEEALRIVEEVDKRCVRLMQKVQSSSLAQKPGMEEYVRGIQLWIAGNKAWSLKTSRYTHKCPADQGLVVPVQDTLPTLYSLT